MSKPEYSVSDLVEMFEAVPVPDLGSTADLDAARALCLWLNHSHVCSGGELQSKYVPPYLASLINEVACLRELRQAVRDWLTDETERPDSAVLFTRVWRLSGLMGERAPDRT